MGAVPEYGDPPQETAGLLPVTAEHSITYSRLFVTAWEGPRFAEPGTVGTDTE